MIQPNSGLPYMKKHITSGWIKLGLTKPSERPKYCLHTAWQDPVTVLFQLTGKTVTTKSCTDWNTVFNDINGFCTNCPRSVINRTLLYSPAVAWTYDPAVSNPNSAVYSETTIVRSSYLFTAWCDRNEIGRIGLQIYVVLRNPHTEWAKGIRAYNSTFPYDQLFNGVMVWY